MNRKILILLLVGIILVGGVGVVCGYPACEGELLPSEAGWGACIGLSEDICKDTYIQPHSDSFGQCRWISGWFSGGYCSPPDRVQQCNPCGTEEDEECIVDSDCDLNVIDKEKYSCENCKCVLIEECGNSLIEGEEDCEISDDVEDKDDCGVGAECKDCKCQNFDKDGDGYGPPPYGTDCFDEPGELRAGAIQGDIWGENVCKEITCCKYLFDGEPNEDNEHLQGNNIYRWTDGPEVCINGSDEFSEYVGPIYLHSGEFPKGEKVEDSICYAEASKPKDKTKLMNSRNIVCGNFKYAACATCVYPHKDSEIYCDGVDNNCYGLEIEPSSNPLVGWRWSSDYCEPGSSNKCMTVDENVVSTRGRWEGARTPYSNEICVISAGGNIGAPKNKNDEDGIDLDKDELNCVLEEGDSSRILNDGCKFWAEAKFMPGAIRGAKGWAGGKPEEYNIFSEVDKEGNQIFYPADNNYIEHYDHNDAECYVKEIYVSKKTVTTRSDKVINDPNLCPKGWVPSKCRSDPNDYPSTEMEVGTGGPYDIFCHCVKEVYTWCNPDKEDQIIATPLAEFGVEGMAKFKENAERVGFEFDEFYFGPGYTITEKCRDGADNDGAEYLSKALFDRTGGAVELNTRFSQNRIIDIKDDSKDTEFLRKLFGSKVDSISILDFGDVPVKLRDVDDDECMKYCWDDDGDGFCANYPQSKRNIDGQAFVDGKYLPSQFFPDPDDYSGDDETQYKIDTIDWVCCEIMGKDEEEGWKHLLYEWVPESECPKKAFPNIQDDRLLVQRKGEPCVNAIEAKPENKIKIWFQEIPGRSLASGKSGYKELEARDVHPFSPHVASVCGKWTDVNGNKDFYEGYQYQNIIYAGPSPFDVDPRTGVESSYCSGKSGDLYCYVGETATFSDLELFWTEFKDAAGKTAIIAMIAVPATSIVGTSLGASFAAGTAGASLISTIGTGAQLLIAVPIGSEFAGRGFEIGNILGRREVLNQISSEDSKKLAEDIKYIGLRSTAIGGFEGAVYSVPIVLEGLSNTKVGRAFLNYQYGKSLKKTEGFYPRTFLRKDGREEIYYYSIRDAMSGQGGVKIRSDGSLLWPDGTITAGGGSYDINLYFPRQGNYFTFKSLVHNPAIENVVEATPGQGLNIENSFALIAPRTSVFNPALISNQLTGPVGALAPITFLPSSARVGAGMVGGMGSEHIKNAFTRLCTQCSCQSSGIPASSGPGCFLAGTKVLMADWTYKNIEDVVVGEKVIAYDIEGEEPVEATVETTFVRDAEEYLIIKYEVIEE